MLVREIEDVVNKVRAFDEYLVQINKNLDRLIITEHKLRRKVKMLKKTNRGIRKILIYLYGRLKDQSDGQH